MTRRAVVGLALVLWTSPARGQAPPSRPEPRPIPPGAREVTYSGKLVLISFPAGSPEPRGLRGCLERSGALARGLHVVERGDEDKLILQPLGPDGSKLPLRKSVAGAFHGTILLWDTRPISFHDGPEECAAFLRRAAAYFEDAAIGNSR